MPFGFLKAMSVVHALVVAAIAFRSGENTTFHDGFEFFGRAVTIDANLSEAPAATSPTAVTAPQYDPFKPVNGPDFLGYDASKPLNVPPSANAPAQAAAPSAPTSREGLAHLLTSDIFAFLATANLGDPINRSFTLDGVRIDITVQVN